MYLRATVNITADKPLEEVAELISTAFLAGVPFEGKDDAVRDEVPAVYTKRNIFGLDFVLYGDAGHYALNVMPTLSLLIPVAFVTASVDDVDLKSWIKTLLSTLSGIKVDGTEYPITDTD